MILVTGASGFIGGRLVADLSRQGLPYRAMRRQADGDPASVVADLTDAASLVAACCGVHTIYHCAGYAHAFAALGDDGLRHWQINFEGARQLVEAAAAAGVKRLVFLSSVKALAEPGELCINEDFPGQPDSDYGRAKRAAEELVLELGRQQGMHVVVLRPAMVYGAGGRGNLERMARLVRAGYFPPLPETANRRSLIHVRDLLDVMQRVAADTRANGRIYIVTGREAPSGRGLFDALRQALGLSAITWAVPQPLLSLAALAGDGLTRCTGRRMPFNSEILSRLLDSACYSSERIASELGWQAQVSLRQGLEEMLGNDEALV